MPSFIVHLKDDVTPEQIEEAKKHVTDQGGKVGHEYKLGFKGFQATLPDDSVNTLESHQHVKQVEKDSEVTTQ